MINESLIPTFGLSSSHDHHIFAKVVLLIIYISLVLCQKSHSLFPFFLEH